eukprot:TRINITY_DN33098_c0_g1_i1.p2 TRINITY_DN33098_c0_g1~~TRINITY_DN33098_c0_g1_i1.p2  ORF type:complete len:215 (-),score=39.95 TRINITY_DN33098_c0_g1_i1:197-841(-)
MAYPYPSTPGDAPDHVFKILVVGVNNAGKTCLIRQYVHKLFQANIKPTIGVDFALKVLERGTRPVTVQIWDIAGQERCGSMTRVYYQAAVGALVVYDSTDPASFDGVSTWKDDIDYKVLMPDGNPIPCVLVANKCDLPENPPRSDEWLDQYARRHGFVGWVRTSARENTRVDDAFHMLIDHVLELHAPPQQPSEPNPHRASLAQPAQAEKKCCR